jgi:hypothetical protein
MKRKDEEIHMKRSRPLEVVPVPTPKGSEHEPAPHGEGLLPIHEFTMGLIAPKGKGKTTTIINMLEFYRGYFHKIFVLSPTVKSDVKWKFAQKLKVLVENKPLKNWLRQMADKRKSDSVVQPMSLDKRFDSLLDDDKFQPEIPESCFFHGNEVVAEIRKLLDKNKDIVDLLDEHGKMKTMADRILIIADDQVGSDLFVGPLKKYFVGANTRHRHHSASIVMVSQGYKEIPKTIRTGWTCLLIYKIGNMKELEVIYEEFPMDLGWDEWYELYREATSEKHDFLFIDMYGPEEYKMRKGFDKALLYV